MNVQEPLKNILHVNFDKRHSLTSTFLRFQEHYESPKFRGEIFTLDEFKTWYIENSKNGKKTGKFTYYSDWSGFNIPSEILNPFYEGDFDPLSEKEKKFLKQFEHKKDKDLFYIIGTYGKKNESVLKHEIAHGLYYTCPEYKSVALDVVENVPKRERNQIRDFLENLGYNKVVFDDETHAYILTELDYLKEGNINIKNLEDAVDKLERNFKNFTSELVLNK